MSPLGQADGLRARSNHAETRPCGPVIQALILPLRRGIPVPRRSTCVTRGYPRSVPSLPGDAGRFPVPRPRRPHARRSVACVVVLGDLMLDVVIAPDRPLQRGTDVPGRIRLRQGGSAATTARWLARLGARTTLVCAIGRDAAGRALSTRVSSDGVRLRAIRVGGVPTGRIAVVLDASGERSFVADRGAADRLAPIDVRPGWFDNVDLLHLPAYSLLGRPLGEAARSAVRIARERGGLVSVDLASIGPLLAGGRDHAWTVVAEVAPDLVFATETEARSLVGGPGLDRLVKLAPLAVVKRGPQGATVLARDGTTILRFDVAARPVKAPDTTGAGDAFDAGFLASWLPARAGGVPRAAALQRATLAGHRAAARQLSSPLPELTFA